MALKTKKNGSAPGGTLPMYRLSRKITPYMFVLPAVLVLLLFKVGPICVSIIGSLYKTGAKNISRFVGLQNYINLFQDKIFYTSLKNREAML